MSNVQVVPGNQLCFDKFENVEAQYKHILQLVQKSGLYEALNTNTRIYTDLVRDFYINGVFNGETLTTTVKGTTISLKAKEVNRALEFLNEGISSLGAISGTEGLHRMRHKKEERLHGLKKKEFPQKYEFLADIMGKCILCKDLAHDSVSGIQLKIMTAIVKRHQLNYGTILLSWMGKKTQEKAPKKVFYGRFISILLKKILKEQIKDAEGDPLNINKRITQRLFANWGRLPSESGETKSQGKRSSPAKEDSASVPLPKKDKRKIEEVQKQSEELSQGSSAPIQKKKKMAMKVSTPEPSKEEELAVKVSEPEPHIESAPSPVHMEDSIKGEHTNSDVEILATGRNAERSHDYGCLYSFLPLMPFHRALCHNAWSQLFWTFKVYPNIQIMAQAYPFDIFFTP